MFVAQKNYFHFHFIYEMFNFQTVKWILFIGLIGSLSSENQRFDNESIRDTVKAHIFVGLKFNCFLTK